MRGVSSLRRSMQLQLLTEGSLRHLDTGGALIENARYAAQVIAMKRTSNANSHTIF
jgi:hypothetical protein